MTWFIGGPAHGERVETAAHFPVIEIPVYPPPASRAGEPRKTVRYHPFRWRDGEVYYLCEHHTPDVGWRDAWPNVALCECSA